MTTDIEIARAAKAQNINKIAEKLGLGENDIETCLLYTSPSPRD